MIPIKELRIGNFVVSGDDNPKDIFVTCKDEDNRKDVDIISAINLLPDAVEVDNDGNYNSASYSMVFDIERINPIPVTKEWLIAFGFKNNVLESKNNEFVWLEGHIGIKGILDMLKPIEIKPVHQLQNLYFAITGEELELKYN